MGNRPRAAFYKSSNHDCYPLAITNREWRTTVDPAERKMVKRYPRPPVPITVTPEELARRYLNGASLDDLGVLCGCTAVRIRRILIAHGVEIRLRGHNHGNGRSTKFVRR
jgi:hypothetical protein